jgi:two-component system, sporulation sensor kinase E
MRKHEVLKIPLFYFLTALVWTVLSDRILPLFLIAPNQFFAIHIIKNVLFLIGTVIMLYILIDRQLRKAQLEKEVYQEREEQLRILIDAIPDFVCYKDAAGRWVEANSFAVDLFQLKKEEYRGKSDFDLAKESDFFHDAFYYCGTMDKQVMETGETIHVEETIPQPSGKFLVFDTVKVPLFHEDGRRKGIVVIGRDITLRKEAEKRLEESEQRYKSLFEQNPDAIFSLDLAGKFISVNVECQKITGFTVNELLQMDFRPLLIEESKIVADRHFELALQGNPQNYEVTARQKNGNFVLLRIKNVPIIVNGEIVGLYGIAKDITEWKKTEEILRKSDRLSVVGQLAAGVAHEIRNPLATLTGFVKLLKEETNDHHFYYDIMSSELGRINLIVSEFLFLAKPQVMEFQDRDIIAIFDHVLTIAQAQANLNNIQFITAFEQNLPLVYCEENQLKQVFINILKNAIESMPAGGVIVIQINHEKDHLRIRFKDQGCGIPPERIANLGEPFYSTKEKGTGLGLMVSYRIIEAHHGQIHVESEIGKGTNIDILLPLEKRTP